MGNLCSKSSNEPEHFSQPGRVLGSTGGGASGRSAAVPQKITSSTPGRTLGTAGGDDGAYDARSAAAKAAEDRARKAQTGSGGCKLSTQLNAQKKQTQNQVLTDASGAERRVRDQDEGAATRAWE